MSWPRPRDLSELPIDVGFCGQYKVFRAKAGDRIEHYDHALRRWGPCTVLGWWADNELLYVRDDDGEISGHAPLTVEFRHRAAASQLNLFTEAS